MPPLIEQKYECSTCNLSVNSLGQLQQHFKGRKHKAKVPADSGSNMPKPTDLSSSSKSISFSHPLGHQNVLNKKQNQEISTTLPPCKDFEGFEVLDFEGFSEQLAWQPRVNEAVLEEKVLNIVDHISELSIPCVLPRVQRFSMKEVHLRKDFKSQGHVMAAVVPQYKSKKVIKKYLNYGKSCPSEISNPKFHSSLTASQKEVGSSVHLQCVDGHQNQPAISYSYKDPTDSNANTITREIINHPTLNHKSKIQPAISYSQNNTQKPHNFSIENILQTGNNSFNKKNISNCMDERRLALNQLNVEYPSSISLPSSPEKRLSNLNSEMDENRKLGLLTSNDKNPRSFISVRKDLMRPVNINQVDTEPVTNVRQSNIKTILQPVEKSILKSILTPSIPNQDAKIIHRSDSNTLSKINSAPPFIRAPLESINNINSSTTLQNTTSISQSSNTKLPMKKKDEMSLKCYTCKKDVFDYLGNTKSLIYDHLIFGRASCKTCSKTVSCSGFTKMRNSNSSCCKSDQLVYTHNPVYYLIGELDNCEKNPCYYLAEYMMKIKVLWIYMPWCQAVVDVKNFVKSPYKIPSFIFKGWDESKSNKQITPLIKQEENHSITEKLNDNEIRNLKSMNKENENPSVKRLLTDKVSPPAKKIKSTLRTFRIKKEFIDNSKSQVRESSEKCNITQTDSINDMKSATKYVPQRNLEFHHNQNMGERNNPSNCNWKNERQSKLDYPTDSFAPQIIDVCSIKDVENPFKSDNAQMSITMENFKDDINNEYYTSQYNEKLNIDNELELSCGSTIMTPDPSPHASPVDSKKLTTDNILSKDTLSSNFTNFTNLRGKICVSKYMQDVTRINSNSLISAKTIEECPMCYQKLSLSKMTVNTENMVLRFVCSCKLNIHILPNSNGKILWPFNDYDYKKSVRILKMQKKRVNKRNLRF